MERLTKRDGLCVKAVFDGDFGTQNILHKLAEYEDLGFTPEDIAYLAKFYKDQTSAEAIEANMKIVAKLLKMERGEAHWIPGKEYTGRGYDSCLDYVEGYRCSECGRFEEEKEPYCNCGCKMTEVK